MSKTRWFFLWLLFIAYLFLGASIFYSIESHEEKKRWEEKRRRNDEIQDIIEANLVSLQFEPHLNNTERENLIRNVYRKMSIYCGRPILRSEPNATVDEEYVWTYYNSFFFALTTLSTIGYGNLAPTTEYGRIIVIIYALIGVPFNGIVLTHLGDFFGSKFLRAHHRYKNHFYESRLTLITDIMTYLIPGMALFIFVPSIIFKICEDWTFVQSVYYAFISLLTIGYGDFVAGQRPINSAYAIFYKIFLIVWIMFGLGYLVMILGFISRAMRSKKINKLERKVAQTLKYTQSKIWNEFVSDVHYLRRLLNEMYLMKVKPVYKDKALPVHVSSSCPNLSEWPVLRRRSELDELKFDDDKDKPIRRRRRAFSENEQIPKLHRVFSDGALDGIDVQATFSAAYMDQQPFLLPSAFASPEESDTEDYKEGGINVFSDEEILASEDYPSSKVSSDSGWFMGGAPLRRQGRAMSDAQFVREGLGHQKTWSGAESLHQFALLKAMRAKSNDEWPRDEEKGTKPFGAPAKGLRRLSMAAVNFFSPANKLKKKSVDASKDQEGLKSHKQRLSLQEEDNEIDNDLNYFSQAPNRRRSIFDVLATSQTNGQTISPVLEQTSIADFIRVVQSLKTMEINNPSSPPPSLSSLFANVPKPQSSSRPRKSTSSMGTVQEPKHNPNRRFSHIPAMSQTPRDSGLFRPRASSISPMFGNITPVDRRLRRLSGTARSSPLSSGRATPTRLQPPSLVITSPDGGHKFSIHNVEPPRKGSLKDSNSKT